MTSRFPISTLALAAVLACQPATTQSTTTVGSTASVSTQPTMGPCKGDVCVNGTVMHMGLEGGFWAIRGDDNVTYDPMGGLPEAYRTEGLRVRLDARRRNDVGGIHMAGPIVEILSITKLQ